MPPTSSLIHHHSTESRAMRRAGGLAGCLMGKPGAKKLVPKQLLL